MAGIKIVRGILILSGEEDHEKEDVLAEALYDKGYSLTRESVNDPALDEWLEKAKFAVVYFNATVAMSSVSSQIDAAYQAGTSFVLLSTDGTMIEKKASAVTGTRFEEVVLGESGISDTIALIENSYAQALKVVKPAPKETGRTPTSKAKPAPEADHSHDSKKLSSSAPEPSSSSSSRTSSAPHPAPSSSRPAPASSGTFTKSGGSSARSSAPSSTTRSSTPSSRPAPTPSSSHPTYHEAYEGAKRRQKWKNIIIAAVVVDVIIGIIIIVYFLLR